MNCLISVIMSVYNEKLEWVQESVESILQQTYANFELIIVIDNPDIESSVLDYLKEKMKRDIRIILIENDVNLGLAKSLNKGIAIAKGNYIARMDADDIALPTRFEKEIRVLNEKKIDMVGTGKVLINEQGDIISEYKRCVTEDVVIKKILPYSSCFIHPSIMIRTEILKAVDGYRNFRQSQDYDLWLRLLSCNYTFANIDEPLIKYRVRENGISCKRPYLQYKTSKYQSNLYKERTKRKQDSFSEDNFKKYLEKYNALSETKNRKYMKSLLILDEGIGKMKTHRISGFICILKAIALFPEMAVVLYGKFVSYKYMQ